MNESDERRMDGNGLIDGLVDGWMGGWMGRCMDG